MFSVDFRNGRGVPIKHSSRLLAKSQRQLVRGLIGGIAIAGAFVAGHASAQTVQHIGHSHGPNGEVVLETTPRNYVTTNQSGLVVVLDRDTGKMRPLTPEEASRLATGLRQLINQSTEGLVQVRHADGSVSMDLQGRFQSVLLARKEEDGTIVQACVDNVENAAAFFDIDPALVGAIQKSSGRPGSKKLETR
jgi:hypothetical protein